MAQAIYREWFVNYRFPGHERVRLVDSGTELGLVPEGWEVTAFSSIAEFMNGYAFKPSDWEEEGIPIIKIAELKNGITPNTPRYRGGLPEKYHIRNGDVLFSWSAHLDVYIWKLGNGFLNQHLFNVIPFEGYSRNFLYFSLQDRMQQFRNRSLGTTMQHIKRVALDQVKAIVPTIDVRNNFDATVAPIVATTINLVSKNEILQRTRDLLLPRLVGGAVEISNV